MNLAEESGTAEWGMSKLTCHPIHPLPTTPLLIYSSFYSYPFPSNTVHSYFFFSAINLLFTIITIIIIIIFNCISTSSNFQTPFHSLQVDEVTLLSFLSGLSPFCYSHSRIFLDFFISSSFIASLFTCSSRLPFPGFISMGLSILYLLYFFFVLILLSFMFSYFSFIYLKLSSFLPSFHIS